MWTDLPLLLAQESAPPPTMEAPAAPATGSDSTAAPGSNGTGQDQAPPASPFGGSTLLIMLAVMFLFIFMMGSGGRKEKKRRAAMLAAMGKGDRVQTIGGVLGVITEIKDNEVTLKVDENSNTRIRYVKSAIQTVIEPHNADGGK